MNEKKSVMNLIMFIISWSKMVTVTNLEFLLYQKIVKLVKKNFARFLLCLTADLSSWVVPL